MASSSANHARLVARETHEANRKNRHHTSLQKICRDIRFAMRRRWHYILRDDSTVIRGYSMFPRSFVNHNHAGCGTEADFRRITYGKQRVTRSERASKRRNEQMRRAEEGRRVQYIHVLKTSDRFLLGFPRSKQRTVQRRTRTDVRHFRTRSAVTEMFVDSKSGSPVRRWVRSLLSFCESEYSMTNDSKGKTPPAQRSKARSATETLGWQNSNLTLKKVCKLGDSLT